MEELIRRLMDRQRTRTEADVQADIRQLLLTAPLSLDECDIENVVLESPLGDRRRIDIELGSAVIEVKRDLRKGRVKDEAIGQLSGYVATRTRQTGRRYVGMLSDGAEWLCYNLVNEELHLVSDITVHNVEDLQRLLAWLEGVLATAQNVSPTASEISARLGAGSSSHALDRATLKNLYDTNKDEPSVRMKRGLWTRLLTSTLGTQFDDTDELFIEHTLLVNSAEIIAHAVIGANVNQINPSDLLAGGTFADSGIYGVVEQDFFDWVIEVAGGQEFIRALAKRLSRFDWSSVNQDVLKVLYESVIGPETRKRLGEYYTPDWLAEAVVEETIRNPLQERVLDPACGSGTFLFHAIRKYVSTAVAEKVPVPQIIQGITRSIFGMDLHPVAVTFARVTYLLAIGRDLLTHPERGMVHIPVYLGDSVQWQDQGNDLWSADNLVVQVEDSRELFTSELRFPDSLLSNAYVFDQLVQSMADMASNRQPGSRVPSLTPVFRRLGIAQSAQQTVENTFRIMCSLYDQGRDHIWGYYVRNLARPMWLTRQPNRVDVLVGNPPWLAYRHMTLNMQATFRRMCEARALWHGAEVATHQDLSALFVARAIQLYLRVGGRFGMVMPNAVVDRESYRGFRTGAFEGAHDTTQVAFTPSWDLRRIRPHFFPRGSSVVFGSRSELASGMPVAMEVWSGRVPRGNLSWEIAQVSVTRTQGIAVQVRREIESPYQTRFRQGAIVAPRVCFVVKDKPAPLLGSVAGTRPVISARSVNEKKPWKQVPSIEGVVEERFIRPFYSGENLLPFRIHGHQSAVVPYEAQRLMRSEDEIRIFSGLTSWWEDAERVWNAYRSNENLSLIDQLDYMGKFSSQFPMAQTRVVYNTAGMHVSASKLNNARAFVDSNLYWCNVTTTAEADYLCAILNCPTTTELLRPLMSYGKDERHVHKHIWQLPIPEYDANNQIHTRLAYLGSQLEAAAQGFIVRSDVHFAATRRHIRHALEQLPESDEIQNIVYEMLS